MSKKEQEPQQDTTKLSIGTDWTSGLGAQKKLFDNPDDFDIVCDRERPITFIYHAPPLNCTVDHLEYNPESQRITVFTNDGQKLDLGVKIQWLIRPYIARNQTVYIVRTENRQIMDGVEAQLIVKK